MAPSQASKYLTGDGNAIGEFLDKFDVRYFLSLKGLSDPWTYIHTYDDSRLSY